MKKKAVHERLRPRGSMRVSHGGALGASEAKGESYCVGVLQRWLIFADGQRCPVACREGKEEEHRWLELKKGKVRLLGAASSSLILPPQQLRGYVRVSGTRGRRRW